ncbi:hypothetical protein ABBQ32_005689 [Trebouxia sp. C0010 RCD-2024]
MYPTIHSSSGVGVPTLYSGLSERDSRGYGSATTNGPSQLASSPSNSNALPVLRVHIADHLSISPPVMTSTETGNIPRTDFSQSFDYEQQVLRDFSVDPQIPSSIEQANSSSLELQRYMQLGHDREAVAMALVAVTASEDKDSEVLKFIEDFSNLKAMGFAPEVITGAMIAFPNDMEGATEACLSCSA